MKRDRVFRLLAALLVLCLLLSGCHTEQKPAQTTETAAPSTLAPSSTAAVTEPPTEAAPASSTEAPDPAGEDYLIRWQNGGQRDYLPDEAVQMVPFSEMEYRRPDTEALYRDFEAVIEEAKGSGDADALLESYYRLYDRYLSFYSMDTLANIRYSLNTGDSYYKAEYDFCEAETPNVEEKLELLYKAFAASPSRNELEALYFGEGFFETYDDYEVYTNEEYLRLSKEEAALLSEYRDLTANPLVSYQGKTKALEEWLESSDYQEYIGALRAYYQQYNPQVGELFLKLVRVRQQLAQALDYPSYADYSYEVNYQRDYTPEQGQAFLEGIQTHLVPLMEELFPQLSMIGYDSLRPTEDQVVEMLRSAAEKLGGSVWDAYRFMMAYELCDIHKAQEKVESSFQAYIYDYEAPFVLVNAQGSGDDYTAFAHEFGHVTDAYRNYNLDEDLETAETYSQAMEFLALCCTDTLSERDSQRLLRAKLADALDIFIYQGAYASFEEQVYKLEPEALTLDAVNQIFLQCCKDYGIYETGFDFYYSQSWIDVVHFFEVPYYIISYCVSAQTSLELYRLEAEQSGEGIAAYFRLLDRPYGKGVQAVMEAAELSNPFREGVLEQTAGFFRRRFGK